MAFDIDVFEFTNKGGRDYNEDSVGYKTDDNGGLFVVADGLGGHSYGELASDCAVKTMLEGWKSPEEARHEWINERLEEANSRILAIQEEKNSVIKSTIVLLAIDGTAAVWAHVGDSRLYYIHRSHMGFITEDHSVAYKKYKAGEISRDEISNDEDQSRLLRSLGSTDRHEPQICISNEPLEAGDCFLLCSDGAWEYLKDEEILIDMLKADSAKQWAELMLLRVMNRIDGSNDNISVMTVMLK